MVSGSNLRKGKFPERATKASWKKNDLGFCFEKDCLGVNKMFRVHIENVSNAPDTGTTDTGTTDT